MRTSTQRFFKYIISRTRTWNQNGAAFIITLMAMLVLMLLSLSLIMQSNTEALISQNEQDAFKALSDAEGFIEWTNRRVRVYVMANRPPDLDPILQGALNSGSHDEIIGFNSTFIGPSGTIDRFDLNDTNEENTSVLWLDTATNYTWEIFRTAPKDGSGNFTGLRTLVFARVIDNYDNTVTRDTDDTDLRMWVEVKTEYPIVVDSNGEELAGIAARPKAERLLVARFAPTGAQAIRTDGDLDIWGDLDVCGECGSAHANGEMDWGNTGNALKACGSVTATGNFIWEGGAIVGDKGLAGEIYIPVINPYDNAYVPSKAVFNHGTPPNTTLPTWLRCNGPSATDPGNAKYFSIVKMSGRTQVYKAYRNFADGDTKWVWRVIGDTSVANLDTVELDDCGRVKACPGIPGCEADQISGAANPNPAVPVANNTFYGMNPDNNYNTDTCTGDTILTSPSPYTWEDGTSQNDWHLNNFWQVPAGNTNNVGLTQSHTAWCTANGGCTYTMPPLPSNPYPLTEQDTTDPGADFDTSEYISNGEITFAGADIYSPLYNAVLFIRANFSYSGNASNLQWSGGSIPIDNDTSFDLNKVWRITLIVTGQIDPGGNVNFAPSTGDPTYQFLIIAGRDLKLHGSANNLTCNGTDCDGAPGGTVSGYAGVIGVHEQVLVEGSVGHNGYIVAEDRAHCDDTNPVNADANDIHGSLQIHYDCNNPTDIWKSQSVKMREWEEIQRVD